MTNSQDQVAILKELNRAKSARMAGNAGMARVCARRAAGLAIGIFVAQNRLPDPGPSAIDRLQYIKSSPAVPIAAKDAVEYLVERVNENFELSSEADLIVEAENLINALLPGIFVEEEK